MIEPITTLLASFLGRRVADAAQPLPENGIIFPGATGMGQGNLSLATKRQVGINATPNEILSQASGINRGWTYDPVTNPLYVSNRRFFGTGVE